MQSGQQFVDGAKMAEDDNMERMRADMAEIKASQQYFHEAVGEMKSALKETSEELHSAALTLKEVAFNIGNAQGRLAGMESEVKVIASKVDSLESTRDKQAGMITIIGLLAGFIGSGIMWALGHFIK